MRNIEVGTVSPFSEYAKALGLLRASVISSHFLCCTISHRCTTHLHGYYLTVMLECPGNATIF